MKFDDIKILFYLGWIVPVVTLFLAWSIIRRRALMNKFAASDLWQNVLPFFDTRKVLYSYLLRLISIIFILIALAGPQWGFLWQENQDQGVDMLIALDVSRSMLAQDVYPNRLVFSKEKIRNFVNSLKKGRVGLIAFSGRAFLQCPLTPDHDGLLLVLKSLDTNSILRGGTAITEAIDVAVRSYKDSGSEKKLLVLITDGENTSGDIDAAIKKAKESSFVVSCIGIGTIEGTPIALSDSDDGGEFLRDDSGNIVKTVLNEKMLKHIAEETGGIYVHSDSDEFGLWKIYNGLTDEMQKQTVSGNIIKVHKERFQFFLVPAFLFLMVGFFMDRRRII